ncbi:MAG: NUDIX domain-containing protein [Oscillospiraceae bacterium]|jgi:8-oxo-dGTP pyrophosphatase MutT (NUDIX family)|nr:NUDIX domain-containing protein [Oscillospiraceae bacterium]
MNAPELWDVYDANRAPAGRTVTRDSANVPPGDYHLVVRAFIVGRDGRILLTKRSPNKRGAGMWEAPAGSVLAGEDSRAGVLREVLEECGVALDPNGGEIFRQGLWTAETYGDISHHWDEWLFLRDVDLSEVRLQEGETCDATLATLGELETLVSGGCFFGGADPLPELRRILR